MEMHHWQRLRRALPRQSDVNPPSSLHTKLVPEYRKMSQSLALPYHCHKNLCSESLRPNVVAAQIEGSTCLATPHHPRKLSHALSTNLIRPLHQSDSCSNQGESVPCTPAAFPQDSQLLPLQCSFGSNEGYPTQCLLPAPPPGSSSPQHHLILAQVLVSQRLVAPQRSSKLPRPLWINLT
eukprot:649820-Rhodomonas_salina.3